MNAADERKVRASFKRLRDAITALSAMVADVRGMCLDLHRRVQMLETISAPAGVDALAEGIKNAQGAAP